MAIDMSSIILVVDDDKSILTVTKAILEAEGYIVITALDGMEVFKILKNRLPHLVILDYMLPDFNGGIIAEKMRGNDETKNVPIIMVSANHAFANLSHSHIDAFLEKPFAIDDLLTVVSRHLSHKN